MAASNKEVVYAFQIFEKRLVLYIFYEKSRKDGSKYSSLLFNQITILFRDLLLGKLSKTFSMFIKFSLASQKFTHPPNNVIWS